MTTMRKDAPPSGRHPVQSETRSNLRPARPSHEAPAGPPDPGRGVVVVVFP